MPPSIDHHVDAGRVPIQYVAHPVFSDPPSAPEPPVAENLTPPPPPPPAQEASSNEPEIQPLDDIPEAPTDEIVSEIPQDAEGNTPASSDDVNVEGEARPEDVKDEPPDPDVPPPPPADDTVQEDAPEASPPAVEEQLPPSDPEPPPPPPVELAPEPVDNDDEKSGESEPAAQQPVESPTTPKSVHFASDTKEPDDTSNGKMKKNNDKRRLTLTGNFKPSAFVRVREPHASPSAPPSPKADRKRKERRSSVSSISSILKGRSSRRGSASSADDRSVVDDGDAKSDVLAGADTELPVEETLGGQDVTTEEVASIEPVADAEEAAASDSVVDSESAATDEPAVEDEQTASSEPAVESEPQAEETSPDAEESVVEEPAADVPETEETAIEEPTIEEPTTEEPATEEPGVEEPATEEPGVEEPTAEESGAEELAAQESATEEPAAEEPTEESSSETNAEPEPEETPAPEPCKCLASMSLQNCRTHRLIDATASEPVDEAEDPVEPSGTEDASADTPELPVVCYLIVVHLALIKFLGRISARFTNAHVGRRTSCCRGAANS
ncbi:hypothetical protein P153DRAFT_98715 [Dothidotthia symphoricarpi CBS 119687]|uniref:Uncharacterized protein n=1 Tax=Dothidotthia symphoricarpi CBS 119687 TaxID=1392245 RepID=A0A6A6ASG6_9PLEO|nr:uncharacterized protein P153DRAFT_98715 [Dothidotthia symphoricarpi CBS 119687]KAF2133787.1 hypothetical protein P153DRAFT_98715 [Dothidotthia symphoricarpi CBS 119687]